MWVMDRNGVNEIRYRVKKRVKSTLLNVEFTPPRSKESGHQTAGPLGRFISPSVLVGGASASWARLGVLMLRPMETNRSFSVGAQHRNNTIGPSHHLKTTKAYLNI